MTIARLAAALAAPAVAAAFLTIGLATAQAAPTGSVNPTGSTNMGPTCAAALSTPVSVPNTTNPLTRAGQLSGSTTPSRIQAPISCSGH